MLYKIDLTIAIIRVTYLIVVVISYFYETRQYFLTIGTKQTIIEKNGNSDLID